MNMANYSIQPNQGVGELRFGMSPDDVRSKLDGEFKSFKRNPEMVYPCDYFESLGVFTYYDDHSGRLEAVELSNWASFDGENLLALSFERVYEILRGYDNEFEIEIDGLTSLKLGVGVYAPFAYDDPTKSPESIIVFRQGYYD